MIKDQVEYPIDEYVSAITGTKAHSFWKSRMEFPRILNERGLLGCGVEIGVQRGVFGSHIRKNWDGELYLGVDPWEQYDGVPDTQDMHNQYRVDAIKAFNAIELNTAKSYVLHRMTSLAAAEMLTLGDEKVDWVYIDDDHSEEAVRANIDAWWPLIKSGGILAGHDWIVDGWHKNEEPLRSYPTKAEVEPNHCGKFGVRRAVVEAFRHPNARYGIQNVYATSPSEDRGWQSWLVVKP